MKTPAKMMVPMWAMACWMMEKWLAYGKLINNVAVIMSKETIITVPPISLTLLKSIPSPHNMYFKYML
ncbi:hypothetical protein VIBNIMADA3021_1040059 [Vibrio nigripulchritudo MADA3021]|nr:hypothetical protein VIBNIMADA3021_1040059 [Vibrio nigripulchritudo MADA3021]